MQIEMSEHQVNIVKALLDEASKRVDLRVALERGLDDANKTQQLAMTGSKLMKELSRQIGKKLEAIPNGKR